jgi:hypothetical protein
MQQKKNTPLENETCISFLENTPDYVKCAHIFAEAIKKGYCVSWKDYGIEFDIARDDFKKGFVRELSKRLREWLKEND